MADPALMPSSNPTPLRPAAKDLLIPADAGRVEVRMANAPIGDILAAYGHLIGKQVVYDNSVQGQLNVLSDGALDQEAAATLIEEAIFLNGFSLVDAEDGGIVKVVGLGRPVRQEGLPVYASVAELPKQERVVTVIFHLEHADAREAAGYLCQYVPPSANVSFTPSRSDLLLVTAPTPLLRTVAKIVAAFDVPAKETARATPEKTNP